MRQAALFFHGGLAALPLLTAGFVLRLDMGLWTAVLAALLLVTLPCLSIAQLQLLDPDMMDRMEAYLGSAVTILILAGLALLAGWGEPGVDAMGLSGIAPEPLALWTGALALFGIGVMMAARFLSGWLGWRETQVVRWMMPESGRERMAFTAISATAGLGEEITYRGFLIPVLGGAMGGPWMAAALTSMSFGILHAYQGPRGMIRAGILGMAFAAVFLVTGSLWPAILAHAIINVVSGLLLGDWLLNAGDE